MRNQLVKVEQFFTGFEDLVCIRGRGGASGGFERLRDFIDECKDNGIVLRCEIREALKAWPGVQG